MLEVLLGCAAAAAMGPWIIKLIRAIERRYQAGDDAKLALLRGDTGHDAHELLDIRSDAFSPGELVATLCVTCDAQLGPEVWKRKADRELAALEAPVEDAEPARKQMSLGEVEKLGFRYTAQSKISGSHNVLAYFACKRNPKHEIQLIFSDKDHLKRFRHYNGFGGLWKGDLDHSKFGPELNPKYRTPYVEVRPSLPDFRLSAKHDAPKGSWSADDYRRREWKTELLESNFDHGAQKYILPLFQSQRVHRLTFDNQAEATKWWGSCIPYDDFIAGRRTVHRGAGNIRSFSSGGIVESFKQEGEKLTDQLARLTGIPAPVLGKMSAAQASEALNLAQFGVPAEMIWEKLPGWTEADTERAKAIMDDGDVVEIHAWGKQDPIKLRRRL